MQHYKGKQVSIEYEGLIDYYEQLLDRMAYSSKMWLYQHLDGIREDVEQHLGLLEMSGLLYERSER